MGWGLRNVQRRKTSALTIVATCTPDTSRKEIPPLCAPVGFQLFITTPKWRRVALDCLTMCLTSLPTRQHILRLARHGSARV